VKPLVEFYKRKSGGDDYRCQCKLCMQEYCRKYYQIPGKRERACFLAREYLKVPENRERNRILARKNYLKNREKRLKYMEGYNKLSHNRERRRLYFQNRRRTDSKFHLDEIMSNAIKDALNGRKMWRGWEALVGYTTEDLSKHLEAQFDRCMSWSNHGSYWHIDHKRPKSWFKYKTSEEPEFRKCWALENLQPLEAKENISKLNRYEN